MAATFAVAAAIGSLALGILGGVFLPLPVSLVTAVVVERRLRRRFRPNPALPPATLRR